MFSVETISTKMLDYYVGRKDAFIIDLRSRFFLIKIIVAKS